MLICKLKFIFFMGLQDLVVTPFYLMLLYALAYWIRPRVTNRDTRKYFIPGLTVKFIGAISLGLVYQFYYGGGDTFNYWTHGSKWVWEAFLDNPVNGFRLIFGPRDYPGDLFQYFQHIWYYKDPQSYYVIRAASFFDLVTLHTYSATALFFAAFSFSGLWAVLSVLAKKYPGSTKHLAIACLFIPSVFFWGSGILKDTITLAALAWLFYGVFQLLHGKSFILNGLIVIAGALILYLIKIYILLCALPAFIIWGYFHYLSSIRYKVVKVLIAPVLLIIAVTAAFYAAQYLTEDNARYSLDQLAETARVTAYDIRYGWGARTGETSGYTLGELDGTWQSMFLLMPAAINVTLFRPYLWEIRNPLMLLAALESLAVAILFVLALPFIFKKGFAVFSEPLLLFCLMFSLTFAFAVGVSTYNFGTLMRYKIPLMPFWGIFLLLIKKVQVK